MFSSTSVLHLAAFDISPQWGSNHAGVDFINICTRLFCSQNSKFGIWHLVNGARIWRNYNWENHSLSHWWNWTAIFAKRRCLFARQKSMMKLITGVLKQYRSCFVKLKFIFSKLKTKFKLWLTWIWRILMANILFITKSIAS